ncbi:uncharacterized protein EI97DRAFT_426355 [Westerdykella ornata]|uniref:Calponin-homology (CH) domain-containing protein n=1 Tax=Westerdykella ornata TaxID=318751 RepID=A0A6A6J9Y4_WESOR|nr:uncharacterized protein EI97DRAFT_426355 [Westerdykella ornata]KAF2272436.1 hypothetical protein EI97DRAFT_426355 [Westerdykella ornata]
MRRYADATPCPAPSLSLHSNRYTEYGHRSSIYAPTYAIEDTTANLDYTTELGANPRHAKPRRAMRASRRTNFDPALDIFEDVAQEEEKQEQLQKAEIKRRSRASILPRIGAESRGTILAHPAQKIPTAAAAAPKAQLTKPHRRRVSELLLDREEAVGNATVQLREDILEKKELKKQGPRKDPRRRTIYVPSEDTTIMTIHPGQPTQRARNPRMRSPNFGLDLVTLSEEEPEDLVSALKKEKKTSRKSLAAPPKRGPLREVKRPPQAAPFLEDAFGSGPGKENVPPGFLEIDLNFTKKDGKPALKPSRVHFNTSKSAQTAQGKSKSDAAQKRLRSQNSYDGSPAKSIKSKVNSTASTKSSTIPPAKPSSRRTLPGKVQMHNPSSSSPFHPDGSPPSALRRRKDRSEPSTEISMLHIVGQPQPVREKYPILAEDLVRPELYEDHWLTYQEVAMTQLLNSVFNSAHAIHENGFSDQDLRLKMLAIYQDPATVLLHKRLQASLTCGALSLPKDLLGQTLRIKDDLGMRKKYLNLWVKTYDLFALRAAAEAIVGRKIAVPSRLSSGSTSSEDGSRQTRAERRAIEAFLETFFIRNEDATRVKSGAGSIANITRGDHHGDEVGSPGWAWRRTMLRSLMLVLLLDKAKIQGAITDCLFQTTSPHKTSEQVLHALGAMLLPSVGDITRPLGHFNYRVEHAQYPLEEYNYHIENIAIDLRDGVMVTRLVELLLYSPTAISDRGDETVTITMPSGELLTSTFNLNQRESWILSQHLKYPSIGRPQKLYNVQVALSALVGVRGIPTQAIEGIKPEDIVDGHREKTLSLLWAVVGKCGLSTLVDWSQLVKEIDRFRESWYSKRDNYEQRDLDSDDDEEATIQLQGLEYHKRLLLSWSRSIARLHGLRVSNLTTSFSDPRVLESIVDTYLPSSLSTGDGTAQLPLAAKLRATGCSSSFVALFTPQHHKNKTIPSRDFTLITLAFLASRLLPLSITHRAASVIQRAYRRRLGRQTAHKRVVLMRLAYACADVARKREKVVCAAMTLQRRWRQVLADRKKRLEREVTLFQAAARGWALRRWARRVTGGRVGGKEKVRRVRGGW